MTIATARRMSLEEYLTYDDGTDTRYELEDGVLVEMGVESTINTWIAMYLAFAFGALGVPPSRVGIKQKIQVKSKYASARDPDLIIHSEGSALAIEGLAESCLKLLEPNPLIVIEVVSPGTEGTKNYKRDYEQKPSEYAARGIPEMWQIDPERSWVKVGKLVDGDYEFETFTGKEAMTSGRSQTIVSPSFPGLKVTAIEVLKAGRR
ncbi:MAG: Uma2 family endonuclease [Alkalinema sp. RU_4_3]|nr:Uma2 family endonuclease [Alkalinema sp. RU_4_3]